MTDDVRAYLDSLLSDMQKHGKDFPGDNREAKITNLHEQFEKLLKLNLDFGPLSKGVWAEYSKVESLPIGDLKFDQFLSKGHSEVNEILNKTKVFFRSAFIPS